MNWAPVEYRRQRPAEPADQRPLQRVLRHPAEQDAGGGGRDPQHAELAEIVTEQAHLGDTEGTQHGNLGRFPAGRVACGNSDRRHRDDQREHDRQREKLARAIERAAHFRAGVFQVLDFLVGFEPGLQPGLETRDLLAGAGEHHAVLDAAARHHQPGVGQVVEIHQHPRREIEDRAAAIRLVGKQPFDVQACFTELQRLAEQLRQLGIDPYLAARGYFATR